MSRKAKEKGLKPERVTCACVYACVYVCVCVRERERERDREREFIVRNVS